MSPSESLLLGGSRDYRCHQVQPQPETPGGEGLCSAWLRSPGHLGAGGVVKGGNYFCIGLYFDKNSQL